MDYAIREVRDTDRRRIIDIYNHFVRTSFAAYPDDEAGPGLFTRLKEMSKGLPFFVVEVEREVIGFGLMSRYHSSPTFKHTSVLTYFILPEYTGRGLGSELLGKLIQKAKARGIHNLLANISSRNEQSLNFHRKHGFTECGRLKDVGVKFGQSFDVVWMQKLLSRDGDCRPL